MAERPVLPHGRPSLPACTSASAMAGTGEKFDKPAGPGSSRITCFDRKHLVVLRALGPPGSPGTRNYVYSNETTKEAHCAGIRLNEANALDTKKLKKHFGDFYEEPIEYWNQPRKLTVVYDPGNEYPCLCELWFNALDYDKQSQAGKVVNVHIKSLGEALFDIGAF